MLKIFFFDFFFLIGFKYIYLFKYNILYPVLSPREDCIFYFFIIINNFDFFFISSFLECGFGSGFFIYFFLKFYVKNFFAIDYLFFSFYLVLKNYFLLFCNLFFFNIDWIYFNFLICVFDILFSNPPYLSYFDSLFFLNSSFKESEYVLLSERDGLFDIYIILKNMFYILKNNCLIFIEHSYNQGKYVRFIMREFGYSNIFTYNDNSNKNRLTICEK